MCGAHNNLQRQLSAWRIGQSAVCLRLPPVALTLILCGSDQPLPLSPPPCGGRKLDERRLRLRLTCKWALARGDARGPETGDLRDTCNVLELRFFYVAISTNPPP